MESQPRNKTDKKKGGNQQKIIDLKNEISKI